jgi:hypothetical protein
MALGKHKIEYEVLEGWGRLPEGWSYVEVAGVACDSQDRVYVFNRGAHPMIVFDKEGRFLNAWGEGVFKGPHGIFIDRDDHLWLADDKDHTVHKFTTDGKKLMTLGESGKAADTGYKIGASPVLRAAGPFHRVTNVACACPTARCTSPTATATPASTNSRKRASCCSRGASRGAGQGSSSCRMA